MHRREALPDFIASRRCIRHLSAQATAVADDGMRHFAIHLRGQCAVEPLARPVSGTGGKEKCPPSLPNPIPRPWKEIFPELETYPLSFNEFCRFKGIATDSFLEQDKARLKSAFELYNQKGLFSEIV